MNKGLSRKKNRNKNAIGIITMMLTLSMMLSGIILNVSKVSAMEIGDSFSYVSSDGSIAVEAEIKDVNEWGYSINFVLSNNSNAAMTNWTMAAKFSGDVGNCSAWNAKYTVSGATVTFAPDGEKTSTTLNAGSQTAGFGAYINNPSSLLTGITVNGVALRTNQGGAGSNPGSSTDKLTKDYTSTYNLTYNYGALLQESLYFYDANMCGTDVGEASLIDWRDDCHVYDKANYTYYDKGLGKNVTREIDLTGGYHDAGDHVKFGLPAAYAATMLGSSYYESKDAYKDLGQTGHLKTITDRFATYFKKCTVLDSQGNVVAFCGQVGDGVQDHTYWGAPEKQDTATSNRVKSGYVFWANASNPGTDIVCESAAALTMNYLNFGNEDDLLYAKKLFAFAQSNSKACFDHTNLKDFYATDTWEDDYCLAAALLYEATGDTQYRTAYQNQADKLGQGGWSISWENVSGLAHLYGADIAKSKSTALNYAKSYVTVYNSNTKADGYFYLCQWGSARYNAATQYMGMIYDNHTDSDYYTAWATGQMQYLLGNNSKGQCYVTGYNDRSAKYPHHRAASGYSNVESNNGKTTMKYQLVGALVGGITGYNGTTPIYEDRANDYTANEVALDYNAGLVGAAAELYLAHKTEGNQQIVSTLYNGSNCKDKDTGTSGGTGTTEQPGGGTGTTEQPGGGTGTTEQPGGGTGTTEQPGGGTGTTEQPGGGTGTTEQPGSGTGTTEQPGGGTGTTEQPGGGTETTEQPQAPEITVNKVSGLKASSRTTSSIKLTWSKVSGNVTGYQVYQYNATTKTYVKKKTLSANTYTVSSLSAGTVYQYKVRAYYTADGKTTYGSYSSVLKATTSPAKVTISKVSSPSKGKLYVKWGKKTGTGYQVQISKSSKFSSPKNYTITSYKTVSKTISSLSKGKTYYVRVRAYRTVGTTKYYGAWSTKKSVKVKK